MAIADNKALVAEIMDLLDEHVTAKASRQLEKQILGHEKIDTTRRYCHANQRNTENSYRKYACL